MRYRKLIPAIAITIAAAVVTTACSSADASGPKDGVTTLRYQGWTDQVLLPEVAADLGFFDGKIKLDSNRQAIGTNFVTEVVDDGKGALFSKVVKVIPNVNQTLGYDPAVFAKIGLPSRTIPECKKY